MPVHSTESTLTRNSGAESADTRQLEFLVIDDHVLFRQGLIMVLEDIYPGSIVHEAGRIDKALEIASKRPLDIVLLDLVLPETTGFDGLNALNSLLPETPVMVISSVENSADINSALSRGARGYIAKSSSSTVLGHAISLVLSGETYLPSHLARNIESFSAEQGAGGAGKLNVAGSAPSLTPRQMEVLNLIARGQTNKEIARNIGTEEGTVKVHVKAVMEKLGANNRTHAVINGTRLGIISQNMFSADAS